MAFKRLLKGLFICLFSFLLMSHNTFAVDFSYNVRLYTTSAIRAVYDSAGYSNSNGIFVDTILAGGFQGEYNDVSVSDGMLVEVPVMVFNAVENNAVDGYVMADEVDCGYISCQLVGFTQSGGSSSTVFHFYLYISSNGTLNNISFTKRNGYALRLYQNERAVMPFISVFRFVDNSSSQQVVPDLSTINSYIVQINNRLNNIYDRLGNIAQNIPSADDIASAITEDEQTATQDAADSSQSSGDQAAADSEQATSSLLNTITGFFNAVINANATNCKFDSHLPFLSGNGEIDLCSISTPPIVQTLSSLVLVGLFIPFCIHMFNRFISITESFQR